jgi:hypothetical protein
MDSNIHVCTPEVMGLMLFIQPFEFIGTNRYKIKFSNNNNLSELKCEYSNGTRFIIILECRDPLQIEQKLKNKFNDIFTPINGTEYFEGNENEMKKEIYDIHFNSTIFANIIFSIPEITITLGYYPIAIFYFIQPAELVGTDRYKIGCARNGSRLTCGHYISESRIIIVLECMKPFEFEQNIKKRFNEKCKLIAGKEYFQGNETEMKKEIYDIFFNFKEIEKPIDEKKIIINHLNAELGLESSYELEQKLPRAKIENIKPYLMANWNKMHDIFHIKDRSKILIKHDTFESHIKLLKKIYFKYCNCDIRPLEQDRNKKTLIYIIEKKNIN